VRPTSGMSDMSAPKRGDCLVIAEDRDHEPLNAWGSELGRLVARNSFHTHCSPTPRSPWRQSRPRPGRLDSRLSTVDWAGADARRTRVHRDAPRPLPNGMLSHDLDQHVRLSAPAARPPLAAASAA
jgi:hypothetical protein